MPPTEPTPVAGVEPHAHTDTGILLSLLRGLDAARIAVPEQVAAEMAAVSAKTLQRATLAGERTGRRRIGTKVVYIVRELEEWLTNRPTT